MTCAVPVLPAMRYGAPTLIARAVPPGPWMVICMPSCTTRTLAGLREMALGAAGVTACQG